MKEETKQKMLRAKAAKKERHRSQTIAVDKDWRILRSDELNWEVQYKGKFQGYYPNVTSALVAIPAKMLDEQARGGLADVLRDVQAIREMIDKAIP